MRQRHKRRTSIDMSIFPNANWAPQYPKDANKIGYIVISKTLGRAHVCYVPSSLAYSFHFLFPLQNVQHSSYVRRASETIIIIRMCTVHTVVIVVYWIWSSSMSTCASACSGCQISQATRQTARTKSSVSAVFGLFTFSENVHTLRYWNFRFPHNAKLHSAHTII